MHDFDRYPLLDGALDLSGTNRIFWAKSLESYTQNTWTNALYKCPSYLGLTLPGTNTQPTGWSTPRGSYAYNFQGSGQIPPKSGTPLMELGLDNRKGSDVRVPSDMIMIGDSGSVAESIDRYYVSNLYRDIRFRHHPGLNLVFCDDHVEFNSVDRLFERTEAGRKRWNYDNEPHPESWKDKP